MVTEHCVSVPAAARVSASGWLVKVAVATALAGAAATPVSAQESPDGAAASELQEVTVTGSRIARTELDSDSPTVAVSSQALQNTAVGRF